MTYSTKGTAYRHVLNVLDDLFEKHANGAKTGQAMHWDAMTKVRTMRPAQDGHQSYDTSSAESLAPSSAARSLPLLALPPLPPRPPRPPRPPVPRPRLRPRPWPWLLPPPPRLPPPPPTAFEMPWSDAACLAADVARAKAALNSGQSTRLCSGFKQSIC